jgi:GTP-binding protein EngB required for normal cell division
MIFSRQFLKKNTVNAIMTKRFSDELEDEVVANKRPNVEKKASLLDVLDPLYRVLDEQKHLLPAEAKPEDVMALIPIVCTVGNQSAGKSSLLSSLTGISLPIGDGRTTAVRIEFRLRRGPEKSIMYFRNDDGSPMCNLMEVTQENLASINNMASEYAMKNGKGQFYENGALIIERSFPDAEQLTYVDLPGLFADNGQNQAELQAVCRMIEKYIVHENCWIVHAISASEDTALAMSTKFVKKYDPSGSRTITVFTKPDIVQIRDILIERMSKQDKNSFVVQTRKCVDNKYIHLSSGQELEELAKYNLPASFRLGCASITSFLSRKVSDMIELNRQKILVGCYSFRKIVSTLLSKIGPETENPRAIFRQWYRSIKFADLRDSKFGELAPQVKKTKDEIKVIFNTRWPAEHKLTEDDVSYRLEKVSGSALVFLAKSEDVLKYYVEKAVTEPRARVEEWIKSILKLTEAIVEEPLTRDLPDACREVGLLLKRRVLARIRVEIEKYSEKLLKSLEETYTTPRLLTNDEVSREIDKINKESWYKVQRLMRENKYDEANRHISDMIEKKNTEAEIIIKKIKLYWSLQMSSLQQNGAVGFEIINTEVVKMIEEEICKFEDDNDFSMIKESPEQALKRSGLKQLEAVIDNAIEVLR